MTPSAVRSLRPLAFGWVCLVQLLGLSAEFGHEFGRCLYPCQSPDKNPLKIPENARNG